MKTVQGTQFLNSLAIVQDSVSRGEGGRRREESISHFLYLRLQCPLEFCFFSMWQQSQAFHYIYIQISLVFQMAASSYSKKWPCKHIFWNFFCNNLYMLLFDYRLQFVWTHVIGLPPHTLTFGKGNIDLEVTLKRAIFGSTHLLSQQSEGRGRKMVVGSGSAQAIKQDLLLQKHSYVLGLERSFSRCLLHRQGVCNTNIRTR